MDQTINAEFSALCIDGLVHGIFSYAFIEEVSVWTSFHIEDIRIKDSRSEPRACFLVRFNTIMKENGSLLKRILSRLVLFILCLNFLQLNDPILALCASIETMFVNLQIFVAKITFEVPLYCCPINNQNLCNSIGNCLLQAKFQNPRMTPFERKVYLTTK